MNSDNARQKMVVAMLTASLAGLYPCAIGAQESPVVKTQPAAQPSSAAAYDEYFMSDEHRKKIYDSNRKRESKAVLYTLLLPGVGNIYAEQYLIAGLEFVLMVFAGTFVAYGASTSQPRIIVVGGVTAGLAYGSGIVSSLIGVKSHNRKLRQGLKVDQEVAELWAPPLVWRF